MAEKKIILTQEHDSILSHFPPNLNRIGIKQFLKTVYIPSLQKQIFSADNQPQYPALLRRQSAIDSFANAVATLYLLRREHKVQIVPNVTVLRELSVDGFCRNCGNLTTEPGTGKAMCDLILRRRAATRK